jgi:hypothetical protein
MWSTLATEGRSEITFACVAAPIIFGPGIPLPFCSIVGQSKITVSLNTGHSRRVDGRFQTILLHGAISAAWARRCM